ncbi:MAG: hypothetical protein AAGE43_01985, partial [Pseudomonadota bacterium]
MRQQELQRCGRRRSFLPGLVRELVATVVATSVMMAAALTSATAAEPAPAEATTVVTGLPAVFCAAEQTGGFHDYPGDGESYEPALFHPQSFQLEENIVLMMNLAGGEGNGTGTVDLYLTMSQTLPATEEAPETVETSELECRQVRGADQSYGYSCVNVPPSEMILINAQTLRYPRTAVGGWTFAGATEALNGDSIFVEYG